MKVLFLDIDGVLNSARTAVAFGGYPFTLKSLAMFDLVAIGLIQRLCSNGVQVVLSSAWRLDHEPASVGAAFGLPIVDRTPSLPGPRGREIADWLGRHPDVECYAIVDDDADMLDEQLPRFVHTDGMEGLTWAKFKQLCSLFGLSPHDGESPRVREWKATALKWDDAA
jgi:hypothetical protein